MGKSRGIGEGSDVLTRVSAKTLGVKDATVIHFKTAPRYRSNDVDISNGELLRVYGLAGLAGPNQGGLRAKVDHLEQKSGFCRVDVTNCDYEILERFSGVINQGIENKRG